MSDALAELAYLHAKPPRIYPPDWTSTERALDLALEKIAALEYIGGLTAGEATAWATVARRIQEQHAGDRAYARRLEQTVRQLQEQIAALLA